MSDVPFRDYIDTRLAELEKRFNERFEALEKAERLAIAQSHYAASQLHWIFTTAISVVALAVALAALFLKK